MPQWSLALPALALSGASDWLDGHMAKRYSRPSVIGSYLDPLADKVRVLEHVCAEEALSASSCVSLKCRLQAGKPAPRHTRRRRASVGAWVQRAGTERENPGR